MKIEDLVILALAGLAAWLIVKSGQNVKTVSNQNNSAPVAWGLTSESASNHYSGISADDSDFGNWGLTSSAASDHYSGI